VTSYALDNRVPFPCGDFLRHGVDTASEANSASCPIGNGIKRPLREVDHSHLHLVPKLRMCGAITPLPVRLHSKSAQLSTGTTLPHEEYVLLGG
jgi:hypothetical protein